MRYLRFDASLPNGFDGWTRQSGRGDSCGRDVGDGRVEEVTAPRPLQRVLETEESGRTPPPERWHRCLCAQQVARQQAAAAGRGQRRVWRIGRNAPCTSWIAWARLLPPCSLTRTASRPPTSSGRTANQVSGTSVVYGISGSSLARARYGRLHPSSHETSASGHRSRLVTRHRSRLVTSTLNSPRSTCGMSSMISMRSRSGWRTYEASRLISV